MEKKDITTVTMLASAGATIGFFVGGPIGAGIGGVVGSVVFLGKYLITKKNE